MRTGNCVDLKLCGLESVISHTVCFIGRKCIHRDIHLRVEKANNELAIIIMITLILKGGHCLIFAVYGVYACT